MKDTLPGHNKYSYLISLVLHGLIVLIFALISLNVKPQSKWQQFDWILDSDHQGNIGSFPKANEEAAQATGEMSKPATALPTKESHSSNDIESPILEGPTQTKPKIQTAPLRESSLNQTPGFTNGTGGDETNSLSLLEGGSDAYFIRKSSPRIIPLEDDIVTVEFSLSADGRVDMNSLNVIKYRRSAHWEALREEMRSWRFGFTGAFKPEKRYRIQCNFKLR